MSNFVGDGIVFTLLIIAPMARPTNYKLKGLLALALCIAAVTGTPAERRALSPTDIWETWTFPAGALQLEGRGPLRPILIAKSINALADATVRGAGAASASATRAFDGDPATCWSPPAGTPLEDWWLEIDLGQVFPLNRSGCASTTPHRPYPFLRSRSPRASTLSTVQT